MASIIKRDDVKQKWEETEFPLVCETCLGDNPYVRMTKEKFGKKCQICETPFTVFAWQAGTKGRLKRVEICKTCAQAKNVCQVCIYDLQYGLPVKVRDKVLRETTGGEGGGAQLGMAVPQSRANRSWYTAQQERALENGEGNNHNIDQLAHAKLQGMARMEPRYERNLPKLCSFYARGECDRGANCPFRHEMPRDRNDPLSKQNTKDRFYGTNDPVAGKIIGKQKRREERQQQKGEQLGYDKARATLYLCFSHKNLRQHQQQQQQPPPPPPPPLPNLTEMDIRDKFYSFGEILSVRVQPQKGQAFIEYTQPEATELAIASMNGKELLGQKLFVAWAKAPKRGENDRGQNDTSGILPQQQQQQQQLSSLSSSQGGLSLNAIRPAPPPRDNTTACDAGGSNIMIRPAPPPGSVAATATTTSASLPQDLLVVKPPPEVAAIVAARRQRLDDTNRPGIVNVPRPGGGPIRRALGARTTKPSLKPYYPSADPGRLGSRSSSST